VAGTAPLNHMRIRNKWRGKGPRSIDENATAAAYIIWQIGLRFAKHLHEQEFDYESGRQRISVIREYLVFTSHVVDRFVYTLLSEQERRAFMNVLVGRAARHYQRNAQELCGPGDYRSELLDSANQRFIQYAQCAFEDAEPGYAARRLLGQAVQDILGMSQTNRWALQQIVDIDGPDAARETREGIAPLLDTAPSTA